MKCSCSMQVLYIINPKQYAINMSTGPKLFIYALSFFLLSNYCLNEQRAKISLTQAGGQVKGLSSTERWINDIMFLISTGRVLIRFPPRSSLTRFRYVISTGKHSKRLFRNTNDCSSTRSPILGGRWVSWLQEASSSVSWDILYNSSGKLDNLLFDTSKIWNKKPNQSPYSSFEGTNKI